MRIRVLHETAYRYAAPARAAVQLLRVTPRSHETQFVRDWRVDVDRPGRIVRREDCYGNVVHVLSLDGPLDAITITVAGEVENEDAAGIVRGTVERFPPLFFRRETSLTRPDAAIEALADDIAAATKGDLDRAHALMLTLHDRIRFDRGHTAAMTTAAEALAIGHGVCQDLTHVYLAAARRIGIPARYVSGYLGGTAGAEEAGHAWAEAHIERLGWVGFDPANAICATAAHVRTAIGLDYLDAAPVRGSVLGGGEESLAVRVRFGGSEQHQA